MSTEATSATQSPLLLEPGVPGTSFGSQEAAKALAAISTSDRDVAGGFDDPADMERSVCSLIDGLEMIDPDSVASPEGDSSSAAAREPFTSTSPAVTVSPAVASSPASSPVAIGDKTTIGSIIADIPYVDGSTEYKQQLDVYLPHIGSAEDLEAAKLRPLVIHIHGGGWIRGDRKHWFYGAPALSEAYAKMGFATVAPSYRLGEYPHFLTDAAEAIAFTVRRLADVLRTKCADPDGLVEAALKNGVVFSGHSAGAHIVSTLATVGGKLKCLKDSPTTAQTIDDVMRRMTRAILLLSGIYTMKNPFSSEPCNWRKCVFDSMYTKRVFLPHGADLDELSPAWHFASFVRDDAELKTTLDRSIGGTAPKKVDTTPRSLDGAQQQVAAEDAVPALLRVPKTVFSAQCDLGLEHDAKRFTEIVRAAASETKAASPLLDYVVVPSTNHASICSKPQAHRAIAAALSTMLNKRPGD